MSINSIVALTYLPVLLIKEELLSVSGERMCIIEVLVNCCWVACPGTL